MASRNAGEDAPLGRVVTARGERAFVRNEARKFFDLVTQVKTRVAADRGATASGATVLDLCCPTCQVDLAARQRDGDQPYLDIGDGVVICANNCGKELSAEMVQALRELEPLAGKQTVLFSTRL